MVKRAIGRDVVKTGGEVKSMVEGARGKRREIANKYYNFLLD
jgi:hypothetical protein